MENKATKVEARDMNVDNCRGCGKLVVKKNGNLFCASCLVAQSAQVGSIKDYILSHPRATIFDIHRDLGVPLKDIRNYIEDRRVSYK
ncbi:hypothetical protein MO973_00700 [Paenibacillus sp. TRM 82003]|nr:hypothetical protein [Paenibacillus sp. TRM 82003]